MPISLICTCGSRLEIDDKFAGQTIPCPDCNKPLVAEPPAPPATRTSGLAVLSLLLALMGAFTVVGTLAAIACGAVALRQLSNKRSSVGGIRIAQAGIILGGVFTIVAVLAYGSRWLAGIDSLARQYAWAGKLDYGVSLTVSKKRFSDDLTYKIDRPSPTWGLFEQTGQKQGDHLLLVNVREDAQILWLSDVRTPDDDDASLRARARDCFLSSEFVRLIGRPPENASESAKERDTNDQEFVLDVALGGIQRSFLFRFESKEGKNHAGAFNILVAGARSHRFGRLKEQFTKAFESFQKEEAAP